MQVRIARIINTYGKRMHPDDGRAIPNFVKQALQGKPLRIYGDGPQTRSFCYVSGLIEVLYRLLLSRETEPVNLGNAQEISLLSLAKTVVELTASKSTLVFEPLPVDDPKRRRPDISKAMRIMKWGPRVGLCEGIKRLLPYFRARLMNRWPHQPEPGWPSPFPHFDERLVQNN